MPEPDPPVHSALLDVLDKIAHTLNDQKVEYALIGGLGVSLRGTLRTTRDIDLLIDVPQIKLPSVLEALRAQGFQFDVAQAIRQWSQDHLLDMRCGQIRVDWLKAVVPVFQTILSRAKWETVGNWQLRVADAEGLLILKLIAFPPRDQEDIQGILAANPGSLDLDWVRREWAGLSGLDENRAKQFETMVKAFYGPV